MGRLLDFVGPGLSRSAINYLRRLLVIKRLTAAPSQIAQETYVYESYDEISVIVWTVVRQQNSWQQLFKALTLMEHILLNG